MYSVGEKRELIQKFCEENGGHAWQVMVEEVRIGNLNKIKPQKNKCIHCGKEKEGKI